MKYQIQLDEIKFRVGSTGVNKNGTPYATCLIYIDARTAYDALDELYGRLGWKFDWDLMDGEYTKYAVAGKLSVYNYDLKEWVTFSDVGYPQSGKYNDDPNTVEWLKDAVSDAAKRCAVQVGIGRELYDAPLLYTEQVVTGANGKVYRVDRNGEIEIREKIAKWYEQMNRNK